MQTFKSEKRSCGLGSLEVERARRSAVGQSSKDSVGSRSGLPSGTSWRPDVVATENHLDARQRQPEQDTDPEGLHRRGGIHHQREQKQQCERESRLQIKAHGDRVRNTVDGYGRIGSMAP